MYGYVYLITNKVNGKLYVGQHSRSDNSLTELDVNYWGSGLKLLNAIQKYGYDNFERSILCWCDNQQELDDQEKYYIQHFDTLNDDVGYNIAEGGRRNGRWIAGYTEEEKQEWRNRISKATKAAMHRPDVQNKMKEYVAKRSSNMAWRKRISESVKKLPPHPMSPETKEKLRKINLGNKYGVGNRSRTGMKNSLEMNLHISEGQKKVVHTPEWNARVSAGLKGKPKSEAHKAALRGPRPKYRWRLPDGSIRITDSNNGVRHKDWVKLDRVED